MRMVRTIQTRPCLMQTLTCDTTKDTSNGMLTTAISSTWRPNSLALTKADTKLTKKSKQTRIRPRVAPTKLTLEHIRAWCLVLNSLPRETNW